MSVLDIMKALWMPSGSKRVSPVILKALREATVLPDQVKGLGTACPVTPRTNCVLMKLE